MALRMLESILFHTLVEDDFTRCGDPEAQAACASGELWFQVHAPAQSPAAFFLSTDMLI